MGQVASPPDTSFVADLDQDISIEITLPKGTYLPATSWTVSWTLWDPAAPSTMIITKAATVTTAGSTTVDALFTVSVADTDWDTEVDTDTTYRWLLKRTDAGSEVDIAKGPFRFRR